MNDPIETLIKVRRSMRITEVIPAKRWHHKPTGRKVSVHGAVPYYSDAEASDWEIIQVGWTWRMENGTIGMGRIPAATKAEAEDVMNTHNEKIDNRLKL